MNLPGAHTDAIPPVESDQSGDRIVQPAALGTPAASSLMSLARPAEDLRRTFYHLRTTDANAQAATDENRHHAQMAHEVADRREQIRELAGTRRKHKKCLRANCGMLLLSPLQIRFTHDSIGEHSVIELTREKGLLPTWLLDVKVRWENDSAAQSAGSSYDKHSQWKSRGTDAAESTESSCDKHSREEARTKVKAELTSNGTLAMLRMS